MGFYFRKSVNLGGLRFNFSKSGVGVSTGVKGFRVGTGPRGNYIQMGKNGIYYKKTWGNSRNKVKNRNTYSNVDRYTKYSYMNNAKEKDVDEYKTQEICDSSSKELVEEITNNNKKITLKWFSLLFCFNIYTFIIAYIILAYLDDKRKNTIIFYDIDEDTEKRLQEFYDSFDELIKSNRKWYILSKNYNFDAKYNAGATSLVDRKSIEITNKKPKYIKTNVKIPCIPVGKQKIYFFPDRILIIKGKKVGALSYKNLEVRVTNGNFIESELKPWDGTVVDYTYRYVNKNGGPDKRFSNNPMYPIMSYSYIRFCGENGFDECIMLSKQGIGNKLKEQINKLQTENILNEKISIAENNKSEIENINNIISNTEKFKQEGISDILKEDIGNRDEKENEKSLIDNTEIKDKKKNMFYKK